MQWWKYSLNHIIKEIYNDAEEDLIKDWLVAYESETGDKSLRMVTSPYILISSLLFSREKSKTERVDYVYIGVDLPHSSTSFEDVVFIISRSGSASGSKSASLTSCAFSFSKSGSFTYKSKNSRSK